MSLRYDIVGFWFGGFRCDQYKYRTSSSCTQTYLPFGPDNVVCFPSAVYIQVHLRLDFIMETNTMNPDLTAPFGTF